SGRIHIDSGAKDAVLNHKSLLPVGIVRVEGDFGKGDVADIVSDGAVIAKGIVSYSSKELASIAGRKSHEIEKLLGYRGHSDAVISENLVLLVS
ncbi:MAG: glutamate 5-kinase, partial [Candidatus Methanomethylophilaceae archaeon]|nr:glutamate 5-kinase [Candidatus Methanomethylophilaceae archaeon]